VRRPTVPTDTAQESMICYLGSWGFAYAEICHQVFGRLTGGRMNAVRRVLAKHGIGVREYRNCRNAQARSVVAGRDSRKRLKVA